MEKVNKMVIICVTTVTLLADIRRKCHHMIHCFGKFTQVIKAGLTKGILQCLDKESCMTIFQD